MDILNKPLMSEIAVPEATTPLVRQKTGESIPMYKFRGKEEDNAGILL
jgi:hypothetical protein